jgi:hypothetical protein
MTSLAADGRLDVRLATANLRPTGCRSYRNRGAAERGGWSRRHTFGKKVKKEKKDKREKKDKQTRKTQEGEERQVREEGDKKRESEKGGPDESVHRPAPRRAQSVACRRLAARIVRGAAAPVPE